MNWNISDIETQPFIFEEMISESRNLNGYHVFRRVSAALRRSQILEISSDSSVDSRAPGQIRPRNWRQLAAAKRNAWGERASRLNDRPLYGAIENTWAILNIPIENQTLHGMHNFMQEDIRINLIRTKRIFHRFIKIGRRIAFSERILRWRLEVIKIRTMLFKELYITRNLLRAMFGINYTILRQSEIIHQTDNTIVIHLASASRCRKVLCIDNAPLTERITRDTKYNLYGKVIIKRSTLRINIACYVLDENNTFMCCHTLGEENVTLYKLLFNRISNYSYGDHGEVTRYDFITPDSTYSIKEYQPVRIMIRKYGVNNLTIVGHRIVQRREGMNDIGIIDIECSCKYGLFIILLTHILLIY